jgi:feruloyl esterase
VDSHLRYYIAPNLNHGGDGASTLTGEALPQYVDLITIATDWVERNVTPPDAPLLSARAVVPPYTVAATRPMCRYPLYPRYKGTGDVHAAESFTCVP